MPRLVLIANPFAGRGRFGLPPQDVLARLQDAGWSGETRLTEGAGDATRLARAAAEGGADLVVAYGGDGTVHETAAGVVGTGCTLAVLPGGSGNDFAVGVGCRDLERGLGTILQGRPRAVDAWSLDGAPFFNSLGLLASGLVSGRAARLWRPLAGWRYRVAALGTLLGYRGQPVTWRLESAAGTSELDGSWLLAEICNGPLTGGGFRFAPDAAWDDGLIDACLIRPVHPLTALRLLPQASAGGRLEHPAILVRQAAQMEFVSDRPVAYHRDGEPGVLAAGRHTVRRLPQGLNVMMLPEEGSRG